MYTKILELVHFELPIRPRNLLLFPPFAFLSCIDDRGRFEDQARQHFVVTVYLSVLKNYSLAAASGSETTCILASVNGSPASLQASMVRCVASSVHIAGTVMTNSKVFPTEETFALASSQNM